MASTLLKLKIHAWGTGSCANSMSMSMSAKQVPNRVWRQQLGVEFCEQRGSSMWLLVSVKDMIHHVVKTKFR